MQDNTPLEDMCVSAFGGPTYPYVAIGGYPGKCILDRNTPLENSAVSLMGCNLFGISR